MNGLENMEEQENKLQETSEEIVYNFIGELIFNEDNGIQAGEM
jgi:hypothetical protein|tara:strand:+ start:1643 stop:1771 length:129 start_codon:yes stop_codon:yes gene_type:complete